MSIASRLEELGIVLPTVPAPVAAYVPAVKVDRMVYTSGQLPMVDGNLKYAGALGRELTVEQGADAARICCLNALAAIAGLVGSLDAVEHVVKLTGWVASADDFTDQPKVMNGASELIGEVFGESGAHARAALGANVLPLGAAVELELIVRLKD